MRVSVGIKQVVMSKNVSCSALRIGGGHCACGHAANIIVFNESCVLIPKDQGRRPGFISPCSSAPCFHVNSNEEIFDVRAIVVDHPAFATYVDVYIPYLIELAMIYSKTLASGLNRPDG